MDIEEVFDVSFDNKKMKPRGRAFTSEENPQKVRWRCLDCDMVSSISGILKHQKYSGHIGKQRQGL